MKNICYFSVDAGVTFRPKYADRETRLGAHLCCDKMIDRSFEDGFVQLLLRITELFLPLCSLVCAQLHLSLPVSSSLVSPGSLHQRFHVNHHQERFLCGSTYLHVSVD